MNLRLLAGAALALLVAGCGGGKSAGTPGIDPETKTIYVGLLNDESGPVAAIGRPYAVGMRILAKQVNAGGTDFLPPGWKIELIERDHGYNPQRSVQMFNEIRDRVLYLGISFGTPNTLPLRPLLRRHKIVAFPASASSKMEEFEFTPAVVPSYKIEALRAVEWIVEQAGGADKVKLGLVYQQDDYGADGEEATMHAAEKLGVPVVSAQTYAAGQADYTAVVAALKQAGATHVVLTTVPSATAPLLGIAAQLDYRPVWVGNSPSWIDRFYEPTVVPPSIFDSYYVTSSSVYWGEDVPLMELFLEAYQKYGRGLAPPDRYILGSYSVGLVQMEVLKRMIESGELSREGFLKALRTMDEYDTRGSVPEPVNYTTLPYETGTQIRILKPDFVRRSWTLVAPYAKPSTLQR